MRERLDSLRGELAALERNASAPAVCMPFATGCDAVDEALGGGLARGGLHEVFAPRLADAAAAAGFTAALAGRAGTAPQDKPHKRALPGKTGKVTRPRARPICRLVWIRQLCAGSEIGRLHAPGLAGLGYDPGAVILVELRDAAGVLQAGLEAVRCAGLGAVIIEPWGEPKMLDFTATRRLALAAAQSGVTAFLLRPGAAPCHSAAQTRWQVCAGPSQTPCPQLAGLLPAAVPGAPSFDITLLRQRAGTAGQNWRLEWDHEQFAFRHVTDLAPLSRPVVSLPARRPAAPAGTSPQREAREQDGQQHNGDRYAVFGR